MCSKSILTSIENKEFVLVYEVEDNKMQHLDGCVVGENTLLDVSNSEELKQVIIEHYGITHLPCLVYKKVPIYFEDDFIERFDRINLQIAVDFVKNLAPTGKLGIVGKGTPEKPYCKYSKSLLATLNEQQIDDFVWFDIFTDSDLREYLKRAVDWRTYPMIFVGQQFIGGLDRFMESLNSGKIFELLQKK